MTIRGKYMAVSTAQVWGVIHSVWQRFVVSGPGLRLLTLKRNDWKRKSRGTLGESMGCLHRTN